MFIYSEEILKFHSHLRKLIRDILQNEMHVTVANKRFKFKGYSYPICTVLFEKKNILGYFEPETYIIGIHKQMLYASPDDLKNLLRHELAHYLCYLLFNNQVNNHGKEYRALCKACGWDKEVFLSKQEISIPLEETQGKVLEKIKKLFSLATSDNPHEAELATTKAKNLLIKHQLEYRDEDSQQFYMIRTLEGKRVQSKHYAISTILGEFNLLPVFNQGKGKFWLEITGSKDEIEVGEYLAFYLDTHLEDIWKKNQKKHGLKGQRAKNSFMSGVAKGYLQKLRSTNDSKLSNSKDLLAFSMTLKVRSKMVYGKTSMTSSSAQINTESLHRGTLAGKNLTVNPGLKNKTQNLFLN